MSTSQADLDGLAEHLQGLDETFVGWLAATQQLNLGQARDTLDQLQGPLLVGLGLMQQFSGANPLGWKPIQLAEVLAKLGADEGDRSIVAALLLYTRFLADTGRWSVELAGPDELAYSLKLLEAELLDGSDLADSIDPQQERAAFERTAALDQVIALLNWIGRRRRLGSTGNLSLDDVVSASAALGEAVATSKAKAADGDLVVRSMWQAPALSLAWLAAEQAGLIEQEGNVMLRTDDGQQLLDGGPLATEVMRRSVSAYVVTLLQASGPDGADVEDALVHTVVLALARAVTGQPLELGLARSTMASISAETGPEEAELDAELAVWVEAGLISLDEGRIETEPGLRPAVAAGLLEHGIDPNSLPAV